MRVALLGFSHETNTFSNVPATLDAFHVYRGEEIVARYRDAHATITGFLQAAEQHGAELVPLIYAHTGPIGMIAAEAFDTLVGEMIEMLRAGGPWDAVLLANHGAAVSEEHHDVDGEIAARVRALVGPDVPVGMAMDLHGNITTRMIEAATAVVFYRTNPHVDARERGVECAEIIFRAMRGEARPVMALETPPLVVNIVKQFTGLEPMAGLMRDCDAVMARPGMLSASVIQGYPYADVAEMGMSFLAVHDGDATAAREAARWLAERAWAQRAGLQGDTPSPEEAIRRAAHQPKGPIVLMDVGDNIGGGSPADSTFLLAEARRQGVRSFLQTLYDPGAVQECLAAGIGETLTVRVGGKTDDRHGQPVEVKGRVRLISDGRFEEWRVTHGGGRFFDQGTTVVVETDDGHTLVLNSNRIGNTSIEQMYSLGIRPEQYQVVVAKGVQSPRPAYEPIAAEIVLVNTPGVTTSDLSFFEYRRRRRPLYPFEPGTALEPRL